MTRSCKKCGSEMRMAKEQRREDREDPRKDFVRFLVTRHYRCKCGERYTVPDVVIEERK